MKHTIFIHAVKKSWMENVQIEVFSFDMTGQGGYMLIDTQEIECESADKVNLTQFELDQIEKDRSKLTDAFHVALKRLDDRKSQLLCLEMTP
jgi:hypothetical protein